MIARLKSMTVKPQNSPCGRSSLQPVLRFCAMLCNIPVDLISNHPFGQQPTRADFLAAEAKPVRVWIQEAFAALEFANLDTITEYRAFMMCSGADRLVTYLQNLCENTYLMNECSVSTLGRAGNPVGLWLWYSTEWMAPKNLFLIPASRTMAYHPYTWNKSYCLLHETLEAEFLIETMQVHDLAAFQRHISATV